MAPWYGDSNRSAVAEAHRFRRDSVNVTHFHRPCRNQNRRPLPISLRKFLMQRAGSTPRIPSLRILLHPIQTLKIHPVRNTPEPSSHRGWRQMPSESLQTALPLFICVIGGRRTSVTTMAMPCSSAASKTSWSRIEPAGWMMALMPCSAPPSTPSRKWEERSEAAHALLRSRLASCACGRRVGAVHAAHLACAMLQGLTAF